MASLGSLIFLVKVIEFGTNLGINMLMQVQGFIITKNFVSANVFSVLQLRTLQISASALVSVIFL